jgi:ribosome-associated heat shock protein Hsp15
VDELDRPRADGKTATAAERLDKWLWHARFFKSRSLAAKLCAGGKVRVNRIVITKPHQPVRPGDVLTFPQGWSIRVVKVTALSLRRGPATEARMLYQDLAQPAPNSADETLRSAPIAEREPGSGRPTKKERRAVERLKDEE